MLIDNKMMFWDEVTIADSTDITEDLDLYGIDIFSFPLSNLDKVHARGNGSTILLHVVINPDSSTVAGGAVEAVVKVGDTAPATAEVIKYEIPSLMSISGKAGVHHVFALPYYIEGRYLTLDLGLSGITGLGANATVSAFLFAQ